MARSSPTELLTKALLGKRLREVLEVKGWKPAELARQLGKLAGRPVDPSMVRRWVDEKKLPSATYMVLLARLFGPDWIGEGGGQRGSRQKPTLSPDQIATEAGKVIAPLIERLAEKSPMTAAMWLIAAATEANRQGVNEVHDLMDLAQELLRKAGANAAPTQDRASGKAVHPPK